MRTKSLSVALTATFLLAGCTPENGASNNQAESTTAIEDGSTESRAASPTTAGTGAATQVAAGAVVQKAVTAPTQDEKALLATIDSRYFGTLTNSLPGENVDLNRLGFPDTSSWVTAARSTDDELLRKARTGGHLEKELYIDRVASLIPDNNWAGLSDTAEDSALAAKILDARSFALQNIGATKSPFSAYQAAALFNATEVGGSPAIIAASFQLASELGDARATRMLQSYTSENPNIDARGVLAAYKFLKSDLRGPRGN